jgi:predicted CopG family antitoxin
MKEGRQSFSRVLLQLMAQQQSSTTSKADFEQSG